MRRKYFCFMIIICVCVLFIIWCGIDDNPKPKEQRDQTEVRLDETIDTIKKGIPYASKRAKKWRDTMYLEYINVGFIGKEQIKNRHGDITYFFYERNVTDKLDADATVDISMSKNCIYNFSSSYGNANQLIGGSEEELDAQNWIIDIPELFDMVESLLGENYLAVYEKPKIIVGCSENIWYFEIYETEDATYSIYELKIDPMKGAITDVIDRRNIE
ncbi:hypothetical protein [Anaerosporobacter sp.]